MTGPKQIVLIDSVNTVKKVIRSLIIFSGFLVVLFGIIPFFIYFNVSSVSRGESSWLETEAQVTGVEIKTSVSSVLVPSSRGGSRKKATKNKTRKVTSYSPEIAYKYTVDGKEFIGRKFRTLGFSSERKSEIEKLISKYPVGGKIKIFYNPSDPVKAAIERAPAPSKVILIFGTIVVCIGLFIIFVISKLSALAIDLVMATNPKLGAS